jgi:hypothetical protein
VALLNRVLASLPRSEGTGIRPMPGIMEDKALAAAMRAVYKKLQPLAGL